MGGQQGWVERFPQRHSWDSRDTAQWPVNWPKESKEDPFRARKEAIHQEINRKTETMGRQFPCAYSCLPWGRKGSPAMNSVSRPHRLPGAPLPVPQRSLRTELIKVLRVSHEHFWSQKWVLIHSRFSSPSRSSARACPTLRRSSQASAQQAHNPNLLSECLERVQPAGQCTEGRGAARGMGSVCRA